MIKRQAIALAEPYIIDRILPLLQKTSKHAHILDIATGQGYMLERLSECGFDHLYGADINPTVFKLNRKKFHFKRVDANTKLPYPTSFFDVVISSETIEHLENPRSFIREVYRILKPKGQLITSIPSIENIFSKLFFLFSSRFAFHTPADYANGHIAILPTWLYDQYCQDVGLIRLTRTYSSCYLPLLKLRIRHPLVLNSFLGWITISQYRKNQ